MKFSKEDNLEVLQNFMGYGNPNSNYWFMGIEEGGEWKEEHFKHGKIFCNFNQEYKNSNKSAFFLTTERLPYSKHDKASFYGKIRIALGLNNWRDVINESLEYSQNTAFICNLFPLSNSKYDKEYPDKYESFFNINSREAYKESFFQIRKCILKEFFKKHLFENNTNTKKILIFHSSQIQNEFIKFINDYCGCKLFNDVEADKIQYGFYKDTKIILIKHLVWNYSGVELKKIMNAEQNK